MNNPLVSVTIAAYNHEKYIQHAIRSVINQTYQNIELLVIDDGSPDNTWQKICEMKEECEKRFPRVVFQTQENVGVAITGARLYGLTQGEYVYSFASDDMVKPQAIEKEVEFLKNNPDYALCVGNDEIIDSDGNVCYWDEEQNIVYDKDKAKYHTFVDLLKNGRDFEFTSDKFGSYETLYGGNYIPNGYLVRKSICSKLASSTESKILEDWFFMLQISKYAKMKYFDKVLFSYRWHATNTIKQTQLMNKYGINTWVEEIKVLENIDQNKVLPDVIKVINKNKRLRKFDKPDYGYCYKYSGVPYIFEIIKYKKTDKKTRVLKILGIEVYKKV